MAFVEAKYISLLRGFIAFDTGKPIGAVAHSPSYTDFGVVKIENKLLEGIKACKTIPEVYEFYKDLELFEEV